MFVECNGDEIGDVVWYEFDVVKEDEKDEEEEKWEFLFFCVVMFNVVEIIDVVFDVDWYGFVVVVIDVIVVVVVEEDEEEDEEDKEEVFIFCEVGIE